MPGDNDSGDREASGTAVGREIAPLGGGLAEENAVTGPSVTDEQIKAGESVTGPTGIGEDMKTIEIATAPTGTGGEVKTAEIATGPTGPEFSTKYRAGKPYREITKGIVKH